MINLSRASAHAIALGAAGLLLAACGGGAGLAPSGAPPAPGAADLPATLAIRMASSAGLATAGHSNQKHSWMSPQAKHVHPLLYSSNALDDQVDVYGANGKSNKLLGELTGFSEPYGMCADKSGNVYIANMQGQDILEYAHGGTSAIKTLTDSYGNPSGCSVNPKTGDLAVTNLLGGPSGYGSLVVYDGASGSGTEYSIGAYTLAWPPVYDRNGNLFFETENDGNGQATVYELPSGGSALVTIAMPAGVTIHSPSGATWDGKYVGITDEEYENGTDEGIYRLKMSGSTATLVGQTSYTDTCYYGYSLVVQPIVYKNKFIGGNFYCYYANTYHLDYWNYENGGNPMRYINGSATSQTSYGQAISK
jgi:hypothetical protein